MPPLSQMLQELDVSFKDPHMLIACAAWARFNLSAIRISEAT